MSMKLTDLEESMTLLKYIKTFYNKWLSNIYKTYLLLNTVWSQRWKL